MIGLPLAIGAVAVFALVQISIFRALPAGLRKYLAYFPLLAIGINIGSSFLIMTFTGTTYFVGPMNFMASILFAAYIVSYKKFRQIHKVKRGRLRFPGLAYGYTKPHWLF